MLFHNPVIVATNTLKWLSYTPDMWCSPVLLAKDTSMLYYYYPALHAKSDHALEPSPNFPLNNSPRGTSLPPADVQKLQFPNTIGFSDRANTTFIKPTSYVSSWKIPFFALHAYAIRDVLTRNMAKDEVTYTFGEVITRGPPSS